MIYVAIGVAFSAGGCLGLMIGALCGAAGRGDQDHH